MLVSDFPEDVSFSWKMFKSRFSYTEEELIINLMTDFLNHSDGYMHNFQVIPLMGNYASEAVESFTIKGKRIITITIYEYLVKYFSFIFSYGEMIDGKYEVKAISLYGSKFTTRFFLQSINRDRATIERADSIMGNNWSLFVKCKDPCYCI